MFGSNAETMHSSFQGLVCRATIKVDFSEMYVTKIDFLSSPVKWGALNQWQILPEVAL